MCAITSMQRSLSMRQLYHAQLRYWKWPVLLLTDFGCSYILSFFLIVKYEATLLELRPAKRQLQRHFSHAQFSQAAQHSSQAVSLFRYYLGPMMLILADKQGTNFVSGINLNVSIKFVTFFRRPSWLTPVNSESLRNLQLSLYKINSPLHICCLKDAHFLRRPTSGSLNLYASVLA